MKTINRFMKLVSTRTTIIETHCENLPFTFWKQCEKQKICTSHSGSKCENRTKTHQFLEESIQQIHVF